MRITLVSINCNEGYYSLGIFNLQAMLALHCKNIPLCSKNYTLENSTNFILLDLLADKGDIYAFSLHHGNFQKTFDVIRSLRILRPGVKVIVGGIDTPGIEGRGDISDWIDYIVHGEGEKTIIELIHAIRTKSPVQSIKGVSYFQNKQLTVNSPRPCHENLDDFPSPYLSGAFQEYGRYQALQLETYRGCIKRCTYCFENRGRTDAAFYSLTRIQEELDYLLRRKQVKRIEFYDTIFNVHPQRTKMLLEYIIQKNRHTSFAGEFRLEWLDPETIDLMARAKFEIIQVGLQSTNRKILEACERECDLIKFKENAFYLLGHTKIKMCIDVMFGLPNDTYQNFLKTIDFVGNIKMRTRSALPIFFITKFHPGTELGKKNGLDILYEQWPPYSFLQQRNVSFKRETRKFYNLFFGYLVLRHTFICSLSQMTNFLLKELLLPLSSFYEHLGSFLSDFPPTRVLFENCEWQDLRNNLFIRSYLRKLDLRYIASFAESYGLERKKLLQLDRHIKKEITLRKRFPGYSL